MKRSSEAGPRPPRRRAANWMWSRLTRTTPMACGCRPLISRAKGRTSASGLYLIHAAGVDRSDLEQVELNVLDEDGWSEFLATIQPAFAGAVEGPSTPGGGQEALGLLADKVKDSRSAVAFIAPRGVGLTAWNPDERKQTQIRRRFMLLGQT